MPTLIYSMSVSLDGYIAGPDGAIDWAAPDEDLMRFHIEQTRELTGHSVWRDDSTRTCWVGRRPSRPGPDPVQLEFARLWKAIPKVVFSSSLTTVEGNARLARGDVAGEVAELTNQPGAGVVSVGGARLAASLAEKDLIDEYRLFVGPVVLGGGTPYFPPLPRRLDLELIETRTFSQVIYSRYGRG